MHIRDNRAYQFAVHLYPFIRNADVYVGEMELENPLTLDFSNSYDLKMQFSSTAYEKMRKQLIKSFQFDIEPYIYQHPLIILSAVSQKMLDADHQVSLDEHLWQFAKQLGKPTFGLESYLEQATLLHSIEPGPLYRQLLKISKKPSGIGRQTRKTLSRYMSNNIHRLYQMTKSSMHGLRKRIIYDRNRVMATRILGFSSDKKYFIAVGAGHLSGKSGLLARLKHAGWKVSPIHIEEAGN